MGKAAQTWVFQFFSTFSISDYYRRCSCCTSSRLVNKQLKADNAHAVTMSPIWGPRSPPCDSTLAEPELHGPILRHTPGATTLLSDMKQNAFRKPDKPIGQPYSLWSWTDLAVGVAQYVALETSWNHVMETPVVEFWERCATYRISLKLMDVQTILTSKYQQYALA